MKNKENLQELIGLIYELNKSKTRDWFLDFCGHVDSVMVHYSEKSKPCECGHKDSNSTYITYQTGYKGMTRLIKKVRKYLDES